MELCPTAPANRPKSRRTAEESRTKHDPSAEIRESLHHAQILLNMNIVGWHISTFLGYQILYSIRNPYINRFTNHFSIHSQPSYPQKMVLHSITARFCLRPYHFAIRCFPYGERSDVPQLQQVEQKAQSLPRVVSPYTLSNLCQCLYAKNLSKIRLLKGNLI
jgi:hypothetical protein